MSDTLRFGIVGAGAIAGAYAQALGKSERASLAAVCDISRPAAEKLAESAQASVFTDHEALLASGEVDAVVVCTPPNTHAPIAVGFLEAGVPVLCEKPLSIDLAGARAIVGASQRTGTLLTMGSKFRYVKDVYEARSRVANGEIGQVILWENAFTATVDMRTRWNSDPRVSGGGVLIDNGTHSVDLMRYFLGPVLEIQAVEGRRAQNLRVDETVHIFARSEDGILGSIDLSWSINKEKDTYIDIYGTEGAIRCGWKGAWLKSHSGGGWEQFGSGYDKVAAFTAQIDNFSGAIAGTEQLIINGDDALASVAVIEAAYASLSDQLWVRVNGQH